VNTLTHCIITYMYLYKCIVPTTVLIILYTYAPHYFRTSYYHDDPVYHVSKNKCRTYTSRRQFLQPIVKKYYLTVCINKIFYVCYRCRIESFEKMLSAAAHSRHSDHNKSFFFYCVNLFLYLMIHLKFCYGD